jgi:hypothetical protein
MEMPFARSRVRVFGSVRSFHATTFRTGRRSGVSGLVCRAQMHPCSW